MGKLVSAVSMTHNPRIFWNAEGAPEADRKAVYAEFAAAKAEIEASQPDVVIVVGNDHLDQFSLDNMPAFAVGVADEAKGPFWYEREVMRLPVYEGPVHRGFAEDLLWAGTESAIDLGRIGEFRVDHAFTVPLSQVTPSGTIPIVPVFTNTFGYPLPLNQRFFKLGEVVRDLVVNRPEHERVALVASFNLSVDVGGPLMGKRSRDFDERALLLMEAGDVDHLVNDYPPARLVGYGNSTAEFLNYLAVLGAVGERQPDRVWYRLVDGWGGCPVVMWRDLT